MRRWRPRRARILFVTGGSGFLGRHVVNGSEAEPWEIVAPSSAALDLRNRQSVLDAIGDWRPDAIIHTAYRRDDRRSIVDASRHVAEAAERCRARLVHVSSDAVFAGRPVPYSESDPPDPVNDYGRHKRDAETAVAATYPAAVLVRTSLLYGVRTISGHERAVQDVTHGHSTVMFFSDEVRSPALVDDVAASLTELAGMRHVHGPLHLGGPDPLSRAELALLTARRLGLERSRLRFCTIAESGLDRPGRVVLDSTLATTLGLAVRGPAALV